jgi:glucosamine-6-phosphate deaminase
MKIFIGIDAVEAGQMAGNRAAALIIDTVRKNGEASILLATGSSQFETLRQLIKRKDVPWEKVTAFHLDEYINLPPYHKASFQKYLTERFLDHVPPLKAVHLINGLNDPEDECRRVSELIRKHPVAVALIGIGENAHLAFNDPPADFDTTEPYIIINELDEDCRQQQVNEGWFENIKQVPGRAISISVHQIMRAEHIICTVPDQRKAWAVKASLEEPVSNAYPASILRYHEDCCLFLDTLSASQLSHPPDFYEKILPQSPMKT